MASHGFFVAGSYAFTAVVIGVLIVRAVLEHRAQFRALAELESRGMQRRSTATARVPQGGELEHATAGIGPP